MQKGESTEKGDDICDDALQMKRKRQYICFIRRAPHVSPVKRLYALSTLYIMSNI